MTKVGLRLGLAVLFATFVQAHSAAIEGLALPPTEGDRSVRGSDVAQGVSEFHGTQVNGRRVNVRVGACSPQPNTTCLYFKEGNGAERSILVTAANLGALEIGLMGLHFPGPYEAIYIYGSFWDPAGSAKTGVFVIDPNQGRTVASVDTKSLKEYNQYNTYFSLVKSPDSRLFPFLAPGQKYINGEYWNYLCLFDTKMIAKPDIRCGTGFRSASTSFTNRHGEDEAQASGFRHNRGWLQDLDGDGWDDIVIPYFKYVLTLSGKTGRQISLSLFDVAEATEPNSQKFFHSGRYYAGYTTFKNPKDHHDMTLLTAGSTVGSFENWNCGVSRYIAAIHWQRNPIGHPEHRVYGSLAWSDYVAFSKTLFKPPYNSIDEVVRRGQGIDHCIHRFSDSMLDVSGTVGMAYSQFNAVEQFDCEQLVFNEQKSGFNEDDMNKTRECMAEKTKSIRGRWNVYVRDASTGKHLASQSSAYLWGRVANFLPGETPLLVVENFSSDDGLVRFDKSGHPPEAFSFNKFAAGFAWTTVASLDNPGFVPRIDHHECYASQSGHASSAPDASCGIPELVVKDIDADGLSDFQLLTPPGHAELWVGYSAALQKVVLKSAPTPVL